MHRDPTSFCSLIRSNSRHGDTKTASNDDDGRYTQLHTEACRQGDAIVTAAAGAATAARPR